MFRTWIEFVLLPVLVLAHFPLDEIHLLEIPLAHSVTQIGHRLNTLPFHLQHRERSPRRLTRRGRL